MTQILKAWPYRASGLVLGALRSQAHLASPRGSSEALERSGGRELNVQFLGFGGQREQYCAEAQQSRSDPECSGDVPLAHAKGAQQWSCGPRLRMLRASDGARSATVGRAALAGLGRSRPRPFATVPAKPWSMLSR